MHKVQGLGLLFILAASVAAQVSNTTAGWQTLRGVAPLVVARGGFSGIYPDSSSVAYLFAVQMSLANTILWCDVQLTKDSAGICFPDLTLDNSSTIRLLSVPQKNKTVNGVSMKGWFTVDFTLNDLANLTLVQGITSRTPEFDGIYAIQTVENVSKNSQPPGFWLNIQHDAFFTQQNLSMRSFVLSVSKSVVVNYISSPEVNFLKSITTRFNSNITKLIFRFMSQTDIEPSTNQTYSSLLNNLTFVKTFASGIMVPKTYIWPIGTDMYLLPHTSIVSDAHREGLEIFASEFANDNVLSYNYSFDPVAEYLSFTDNGIFFVDGVVSDFPRTPSAAIDCYSHISSNVSAKANFSIISHNGASGDYPGCTDLAYMKAITDGVDILDCPVQMTKDAIAICLPSVNLLDDTTAEATFSDRTDTIAEISQNPGIYTFNLTWAEIQSLQSQISTPYARDYSMYRNPINSHSGTFLTLSEFLALAKNTSSLSGVLINIENAVYLAKQGVSIIDAVLDSLRKSGYDDQSVQKIMIQSTKSSVLKKFTEKPYELVYMLDENIRDALNSTVEKIKSFAHSVVLNKGSISVYNDGGFIVGSTAVVPKLKAFNLTVYGQLLRNEFVSQAQDFMGDANVELNTYVQGSGIDGVVTEFPKTAAAYRRNRCLGMGNNTPSYMGGIPAGFFNTSNSSPSPPTLPILTDSDVDEAPIPSVTPSPGPPSWTSNGSGSGAPPPAASTGRHEFEWSALLSIPAMLLGISHQLL